ncbi:alpha/beta fold hydrolase [Halovenus salina]|uniref:Alpha/beta fold hydrolase n=1 Tax=Halovenus salina TaxID=1510225 RepID=A0ABD5W037_9EURY|nr:alpha/beta hydrolase [Halovenus salina]
MTVPDGVSSRTVSTDRLETHLLESGAEDGDPVVFVHGNASSSRFYAELLADLPEEYRAIAPDLRGYGRSERRPIDATRGLRDFGEDIRALVTELGIQRPALVGWSTGGGVAMRYAIEHPKEVASLALLNPVSPYGYGGTRRDGTPCQPDYAGTGAGMANEEFIERLEAGDRSADSDASPRNVMRSFYLAPETELDPDIEDTYVDALLDTETGDDYYPGDATPSENWPGVAPGEGGTNNALSPKYLDLTGIDEVNPKPPILWIRGAEDRIVSDTSFFDAGYLGKIGELPDWPGEDEYPPQPMVSQTRDVFEAYADAGGAYEEVVVKEAGHSPHIEQHDEVLSALTVHLDG